MKTHKYALKRLYDRKYTEDVDNYEHNLDDSITEKIYNLMKTELDRITKILND